MCFLRRPFAFLVLSTVLLFMCSPAQARSISFRIIDWKGNLIQSVYQGLRANPRYANQLLPWRSAPSTLKVATFGQSGRNTPCALVQTAFHNGRDKARLRSVQFDCSGHYMVLQIRDCTQGCGGGTYDWYYSSQDGEYLSGYYIAGDGCGGCTLQEGQCENGNIH